MTSVPEPLSAALPPAWNRTDPSASTAQMSGTVSPLALGVPIRWGLALLAQPDAPYSLSSPPEEPAAVASELRLTPSPDAAMPLRSHNFPETSER